jgi:hypothetical protein
MSTATVPISNASHDRLKDLAAQSGKSPGRIVEEALDLYRRRAFLEAGNAAYAALRSDPEAWREELAERQAWDVTLADGLPDEA